MSDTITAAEYARLTKRRKYGNTPVTIEGYHHDSKAEARRWREL